MRQQSMGSPRENCITGIPIAGTYMACLALSAQVSLNILNPALAFAMIMEPLIFGASYGATVPLPPIQKIQVNKALTPFVGGLLAAVVFYGQKKIIESRGINYSKDFVRGSIRLNNSQNESVILKD